MSRLWNSLSLVLGLILVTGCDDQRSSGSSDSEQASGEAVNFRDLNGNGNLEPYEDTSLPVAERVDDLLSRMSLEEKVQMVSGTGWDPAGQGAGVGKVPGVAGYTNALENFGIPSIVLADGPAGLRIWPERDGDSNTYYATAFPIETVLASSWDRDLLERVGMAMGNEVKEYGVDVLLAPGMNIHRDPRGGRNFEYYSEDPFLSGWMAAAMVNGVESVGVGATVKHYVANNQETNRLLLDAVIDERALREIYLRGFQIAVEESRPWAVMSAYNQINGLFGSESKPLLTTVLRDEWGYEGVVMTDWFAGQDPVKQLQAGNELLMPGMDDRTEQIMKAAQAGELDEAVLDRNAGFILQMVFRSPAFENYDFSNAPDLTANAATARAAAAEGVVLLKNENRALPLDKAVKKIAAFGNTSYEFIAGGTGSGDVNEAYTVSLVQGLEERGLIVDSELKNTYSTFIAQENAKRPKKEQWFELLPPIAEMPVPAELLAAKAAEADVGFVTIGRNSGEFQDRELEGDFYLTDAEKSLISGVAEAFHAQGKKVVLILNIGNVVEIASWRDQVDAIVLPWQGGQEAGNAVVDVLTGQVNPSGKLPTTFPIRYDDVPTAEYFPGVELAAEPVSVAGGLLQAMPARVEYREGIFVGYRYYDSFEVEPAYEFGYGLSYTSFEYSDLSLSRDTFEDSVTATVRVTNSGDVSGREVVQLYVAAPPGSIPKPAKELKGFAKTRKLAPGETQELTFALSAAELASFHEQRAAWIAEPGVYTISVGASSRNIRATKTFTVGDELLVEAVAADLSPDKKLDEFKP